jgi:transposase
VYLKKAKMKSGRIYLSRVEGHYDPVKKQSKTVNIQSLGYLDILMREYPNPIEHFTAVIEEMNKRRVEEKAPITLTLDPAQRVQGNERKNFGYVALSAIYHELEIDKFFTNRKQSLNVKYNMNQIMRLLVFARLLAPGSKKKAFEERDWFFERCDFRISDMYRSLTRFNDFREALQLWIHERVVSNYGRDTTITYYDVTNYYFEIDKQDDLRKKGVSKEHRPDPIVQMGLLMDNSGIPIAYQLFPGNSNDCTTLLPVIKRIRREYGTGKAVIVSDKGLNTQKNAYYLANKRGGYVFSQTVRGGSVALKKYVLDEKDYVWTSKDFKKKSRQFTREVDFIDESGNRICAKIAEKQVAFYSRDYDIKAKADRQNVIKKARAIIKNPENFNKQNTYGAAKYIRQIVFDKDTGEIVETQSNLQFNDEFLAEEEKYDGYYMIVSSRHFESDDWIIETYKGLWRIEETFKVTKKDLETRPVHVSLEAHIQAHFLTCFVALVIVRLLQHRLKNAFSCGKILHSLSKACCSRIDGNLFMFDYEDDVIDSISRLFDIDLAQKFRRRDEIKNILANIKIHNYTMKK